MFSSKPHVAVITRGLFFSIRYSILLYNFPYSREVGYIIIKTVITKRSFEAPTIPIKNFTDRREIFWESGKLRHSSAYFLILFYDVAHLQLIYILLSLGF